MQRFYLPDTPLLLEGIIITDTEILHQLTRVLRSQVGDTYILFDGKTPEDHVYQVTEISKKSISFSYIKKVEKNSELDFELVLYQAIPNKFSKLEYIAQKCSEIGFSKIVFFSSERSQKLILSENKKDRLNKIIQESIEQCGRNKLCQLEFPTSLSLEQWDTLNIVFHQELDDGSIPIKQLSTKTGQNVHIFVWPEGGFSDDEVAWFQKQNFQRVYLWERILRCETAWVVTGFFLSQSH